MRNHQGPSKQKRAFFHKKGSEQVEKKIEKAKKGGEEARFCLKEAEKKGVFWFTTGI